MRNIFKGIQDGLAEAETNQIAYLPLDVFKLEFAWACESPPEPDWPIIHNPCSLAADSASKRPDPPPPQRPPPWYMGLSKNFNKAIVGIDRRLQGRILEALAAITSDPITPRGDTVKPLTGELQGCWRYRIGSYRLVYSPNKSTGDITLLAFAARGSSYGE